MRSKWKRIFASVITFVLVIGMGFGIPVKAEQINDDWYTNGQFTWMFNYYGKLCLYMADVLEDQLTYRYGETLVIPSMVDGHSVDYIGSFSMHNEIKKVIIENGITRIGSNAFEDLNELTDITIPMSVKEIGEYAFQNCGFTTLYIPSSVTTLEYLGEIPNLKTLYYPSACIPSQSYAALVGGDNASEISYVINEDDTVSLTMQQSSFNDYCNQVPFSIPETVGGHTVASFQISDGVGFKPQITCDRHKPDQWYYDENKHWFTKCSVCGNEVKGEAHTYEASNPNNACDCGYIPFTYTPSQQDCTTEYGNTAGTTLSVAVKPTLGNENITYQWYENDAAIAGANQASYTVPAGKKVGAYTYYCKMSCGGYEVTGEKSTVTVVKKKITVTADSKKKYAGEANPALTYTVPAGALAAGDTTTDWQAVLATTATQNSPAGTYPITGTITASQYDITVTPGTLTVEAKKTDDTSSTGQSGGNGSDTETYVNPDKVTPKKGQCFKKGNAVYKVTKTGKNATVTFLRPIKKKTSLSIPATVKAGKVTYKVTAVAKYACKKNTKLKKLTIGKNVTSIGKQAFYGCKNLKSITVKTTKLNKNKVGKQVFKGISKQAVVKMPKKKFGPYKKLLDIK